MCVKFISFLIWRTRISSLMCFFFFVGCSPRNMNKRKMSARGRSSAYCIVIPHRLRRRSYQLYEYARTYLMQVADRYQVLTGISTVQCRDSTLVPKYVPKVVVTISPVCPEYHKVLRNVRSETRVVETSRITDS